MYESKTMDWKRIVSAIVKVSNEITGLPVVYEHNRDNQTNYPFVSFDFMNDHTSLDYSAYRNQEMFYTTITFKAQSQSAAEALAISDDLRTLFQDVKYRDELRNYGIVLAHNAIQDEHLTDSTNLPIMNYAVAGFDLVIGVSRNYKSDYPQINKLGGITDYGSN